MLPCMSVRIRFDFDLKAAAGGGSNDLLRQQNAEKMSLERDLQQEEHNSLNTKLQSSHSDRQTILDDAAARLAQKLQGLLLILLYTTHQLYSKLSYIQIDCRLVE